MAAPNFVDTTSQNLSNDKRDWNCSPLFWRNGHNLSKPQPTPPKSQKFLTILLILLIGLSVGLLINGLKPTNSFGKIDYSIALNITKNFFPASLEILAAGEDLQNLFIALLPGETKEKHFILHLKSPTDWRLVVRLSNNQTVENLPQITLAGSISATSSRIKISKSISLAPNNLEVDLASGGPTDADGLFLDMTMFFHSTYEKAFNDLVGNLEFSLISADESK